VSEEALEAGITQRTLKRARNELQVKACKKGYPGNWYLLLPGQELDEPDLSGRLAASSA